MYYDPYSKDLRSTVFDIETTGLYPGRDRIISASFIDPDGTDLQQFFCEDSSSEDYIVSRIIETISGYDSVITFNGQSFDLPFVLTRARRYGIADELPLMRSVDVYRLLKNYWPLASSMPSLRQKAVEEALGITSSRDDLIGGDECIRLYSEYVNLGREEAKDLILLHNGDDVRQLAGITRALSFLPYAQIAFEKGFLIKLERTDLFGTSTHKLLTGASELSKGKLSVKARIEPACIPAAFYEDSFSLQASSDGHIRLDIFVQEKEGYTFADLKALKIPEEALGPSANTQSGYAVLAKDGETDFTTCNELTKTMLERLV